MQHAEVIARLGGIQGLAREIRAHHTSVARWRGEGIPAARWPDVVALAKQHGEQEITFEALAEGARNLEDPPPLPLGRKRKPKPRDAAGRPVAMGAR